MTEVPVVVVREPGRTTLHLLLHEALEVGRDCPGLLIDDPRVSRRHLQLRPTDGGVTVIDLGSANGTTVDGDTIERPVSLAPGSVVRLGDTTIELATPAAAESPPEQVTRSRTAIERIAAEAARERPLPPKSALAEGTVTIVFSDIESSTELAFQFGDQLWLEVLRAHNRIVRARLGEYAGTEVKAQGDGFMLAFTSARRALQCMIAVQRDLAAAGERRPDRAVRVRVGVHTGEVIADDGGDLFGRHVNLAARIAGEAVGGEILVSSLVREIVEARGDLRFGRPRSVRLKGLEGTFRLHPVVWSDMQT
jgi:class 3 adenylate cyclase